MEVYNARIVYVTLDNIVESLERTGFTSVPDATEWLSAKLGWIMLNWGKISPDGLLVTAEVYDGDNGFSDLYELKCGL